MNFWNMASWRIGIKRNPMVALLLLGSLIGAVIVEISPSLTNGLFFAHPNQAEYLRMISPIFLHFGLLHLVFNCLWLGLLGSRIETQQGAIHLLFIVLISGVASNMAQYYWSGTVYFGGMSGVIYALLGYLWVKNKIAPQHYAPLPSGLMGFMVGWLVLCMTGVLEVALGIGVANAAHLSGLVAGLFIGLVFALKALAVSDNSEQ
ncbi:rhomboid family intramembrane serine protease [Porticoccaceae bacterium]|jgi:GlpG protein|nr:rhomboid family intramembrane serine protease [Porticoccaceae bacterium]